MAPPPPPPSATDLFFANNQSLILIGAFATQIAHHQYIKATPGIVSTNASFHIPRTLRAGLGWGVVFIGLLTQITIAKQAVRNHNDPVLAHSQQRKPWKRNFEERL